MCDDRDAPAGGIASNVIVMNRHRTDRRFPHIGRVEAYWQALRGRRAMPDRAEIDPRGIEGSLEYAFILEQIAPGVGRLRIAGTHLADLLGMEVRGMPFSAFVTPEARSALARCIEAVGSVPAMAILSLQAEPGIGKPVLEARLLLLPLRGEDGAASRILGCLDTAGSIGRAPRRFVITDQRLTRISGQPGADRDGMPLRPAQPQAAPVSGFADGVASFRSAPQAAGPGTAAKPNSHLRLITPEA